MLTCKAFTVDGNVNIVLMQPTVRNFAGIYTRIWDVKVTPIGIRMVELNASSILASSRVLRNVSIPIIRISSSSIWKYKTSRIQSRGIGAAVDTQSCA